MIRIEHINTKSVVFNLLKIRHFLINIKILLVYVHLVFIFGLDFPWKYKPLSRQLPWCLMGCQMKSKYPLPR